MKKILAILKKYREIINYLIVGILTTLVSLVTYYALVYTILNVENAIELQIANVISWITCVTFAYVANRIFVFKSKEKKIVKEILTFTSSRITTLLIDMGLMFLFVTTLGINDKIMKIIVQIIIIILNYIFSKLLVFKKR